MLIVDMIKGTLNWNVVLVTVVTGLNIVFCFVELFIIHPSESVSVLCAMDVPAAICSLLFIHLYLDEEPHLKI